MAFPDDTTRSPVNERSIDASTDRVVDEARIVMNPTRATPIISAAAVVAVRLGLRIAFSLARLPGTPRNRGNGAPITRLIGRAIVGPSTRDADEDGRRTESEQRHSGATEQPGEHQSPAPKPVTPMPTMARRRLRPDRSTATSRKAAIGSHLARPAGREHGGDDADQRAGDQRDDHVRLEITTEPDGKSMPIADIIDWSPARHADAGKRPVTEATKPTASASTSTDDITCRRPAPIARNIAISLVRWATRIENEL